MRIKVIQRPPVASIDGLDLSHFHVGCLYDVGTAVGSVMLAEHWAEPCLDDSPALLVPLRARAQSAAASKFVLECSFKQSDQKPPPNQRREEAAPSGIDARAISGRGAADSAYTTPPNLIREVSPPSLDVRGVAAEFRRRNRR